MGSTAAHGSCNGGAFSSSPLPPGCLVLLARAFLNQPAGTETSPTPGMPSIVFRLSSIAWLK
jgi:hypothetical protein